MFRFSISLRLIASNELKTERWSVSLSRILIRTQAAVTCDLDTLSTSKPSSIRSITFLGEVLFENYHFPGRKLYLRTITFLGGCYIWELSLSWRRFYLRTITFLEEVIFENYHFPGRRFYWRTSLLSLPGRFYFTTLLHV